jgi:hypothetical protein
MPLITPADLRTHIYAEIITEITRNDETIVAQAIQAAEGEAMLYLSRYDIQQIFGTSDAPSTFDDPLLLRLLKDITVWHIIRLSNAGVDQATHRTAYLDAIQILTGIKDGRVSPHAWPYADTTTTTTSSPPDGDTISWNSNLKRHNHY